MDNVLHWDRLNSLECASYQGCLIYSQQPLVSSTIMYIYKILLIGTTPLICHWHNSSYLLIYRESVKSKHATLFHGKLLWRASLLGYVRTLVWYSVCVVCHFLSIEALFIPWKLWCKYVYEKGVSFFAMFFQQWKYEILRMFLLPRFPYIFPTTPSFINNHVSL